MHVELQTQPTATPVWPMLRTLGVIATLSGLLVVLADQITQPMIAEKQRLLTEQLVFQVIPGAVTKRDFIITADGRLEATASGASGEPIYAAYTAAGQLQAVAIVGSGGGYAGPVQVMFAYDPSCQCIVGSQVLKSNETPGFGDKLDTDPAFRENFRALEARVDTAGTALANPIVTVKHGTKTAPWQIDAITGATISSRAMGKAANQAAQRAAPVIQRDLAKLTQPN
ncbi:electron transport complex protein RnfG [Allochromatium warmingii]|uniref:Ion-translocating oxidoreductase complex subunit G n=1 Tax=Allochromatium warmingii TaxID=61595 RepID=A0A1H3FAN4_ALLWA|nr:FMN-binding protein [Allochromatium warmingii]SDX88000.1 electron transport complex protein RnfG [Allochromatium warmingii]